MRAPASVVGKISELTSSAWRRRAIAFSHGMAESEIGPGWVYAPGGFIPPLLERLRCGARGCGASVRPGVALCDWHDRVDRARMFGGCRVDLRPCGVRGCAGVARVGYVCTSCAVTVEILA